VTVPALSGIPGASTAATAPTTNRGLRARERDIAERFTGGFPWPMFAWGIGNTALWLSLWPLVLAGILPLWAGFLIACFIMAVAYLPSHEAQHDVYFSRHSRWHWVNELIGQIALIPLALPLSVLRVTHLEHHRHTNDPDLDPDYYMNADTVRGALWKAMTKFQPRNDDYARALQRLGTPAAKRALLETLASRVLYYGILVALAWTGLAIEAALLWCLPRLVGLTYTNFFLSWTPHYPAPEQGRYRNTRSFKSAVGHYGSSGMQYHLIHHLYPTIPLHRHRSAYRALLPILREQGCDLGGLKH
jgi:beta-carotene hydroxylase